MNIIVSLFIYQVGILRSQALGGGRGLCREQQLGGEHGDRGGGRDLSQEAE